MKSKGRIIFRCDAGRIPGVSMGHAFRCMALAREIMQTGTEVLFLMQDYPEGVNAVRSRGFAVETIDRTLSPHKESEILAGMPGDVIVFDLLNAGPITHALPAMDKRVVVIDDTGENVVCGHLIINGSIAAERLTYPGSTPEATLLLGPSYCILGEEFDEIPMQTGERRHDLVIFMGGSDPAGLTMKVARFLIRSNSSLAIEIILGSSFAGEDGVRTLMADYAAPCKITSAPASIVPAFHNARLALVAGGRTVYEAAATGLPGIILPSIEHENRAARLFSATGAFVHVEHAWQLAGDEFERQLAVQLKLVEDSSQVVDMASKAIRLVDRAGRRRVSVAILDQLRHSRPPVTM